MLSAEDNEFLTRTDEGTAMGMLLRLYWIPVVKSDELDAGGRVKRVQLLGEHLVVYRATTGTVAIVGEHCPHRGASLYFGRVEAEGIRCAYHGWKFSFTGQCIDMPGEPTECSFAAKIRHVAYPCVERGGVAWTYMGPGQTPALPDLEWALLPAAHVLISKRVHDCNWLQGLEGGVDSAHISFLHAPINQKDSLVTRDMDRIGFGVGAAIQTGDRAPRVEAIDTDYGVMIGARRTKPDGQWYWRFTQFLMPFYVIPPADTEGKLLQSHMWVPMDGSHVLNWMITWHIDRPLTSDEIKIQIEGKGAHICNYLPATSEPYGDVRTAANRHNDYFMDWDAHRSRMFCGIPGFGAQDKAIQESQGAIADRSREHLGPSDAGIIQIRKRLASAALALREGRATTEELRPASYLVRSGSAVLSSGANWTEAAAARTRVVRVESPSFG